MRMIVLGAGLQGSACAADWLRQPDVTSVRIIDSSAERLSVLEKQFQDGRLATCCCDVSDEDRLVDVIADGDALVSAVPYFLNLGLTKVAIRARTHMVDMGGNTDIVFQQRSLDEEAKASGIGVLPDQGLAPGLAGILGAHAIRDMDSVRSLKLRVGGLPQKRPDNSLGYALVFSIHGLINEYVGDAIGLRNGEISREPALTGLETIQFPEIGRCEAAYTSGGTSTLPWSLEGRVDRLDYKTVRHPGHWKRVRFLEEIGLFGTEPVTIGRNKVSPREVLAELLGPRLSIPLVRDLVVLRVTARGRRGQQNVVRRYELLDRFDEKMGLSAMMRTTAFPAAESALLLARNQIRERGVLAAEKVVPGELYLRSLRARGLAIREVETTTDEGHDD